MAEVTFHVVVHEEDDGSFWAEVQELPGCFASGFSWEELREALTEAMQVWLPDGITLGEPKWSEPKLMKSKAGKKRAAPVKELLVCA